MVRIWIGREGVEVRKSGFPVPRPPHPLRLFIAAYPPPEAARAMLALLDAPPPLPPPPPPPGEMPRGAMGRITPAERVHLTVHFIGETDPRRLEAVRESVQRSAAGIAPFTLTPRRLVSMPARRPRLLALEADPAPALLELHRRLVHRLARPANRPSAARHPPFIPHFTLVRYAHTDSPTPVDLPVASFPILINAVHLMQSVLRHGGAEHRPIEVTLLL